MPMPYDDSMKLFIEQYSQAFASWLFKGAIFTNQLKTEFKTKTWTIIADVILEMWIEGQRCILELEFQSEIDETIPQRLLEYNMRARREYGCPVYSCVIYVHCKGNIPQSPLQWDFPGKRDVLSFQYMSVHLSDMTVEQLREIGLVELTPLWMLTGNGATRQVVEEAIETLASSEQKDLLSFTQLFASLAFTHRADQDWLTRRFAMLYETLRDTPAFQRILNEGLEQGLEKGREEGLEQGLERGRAEGQRQVLYALIQRRFPDVVPWVKKRLDKIEKPGVLLDLIIQLGDAQSSKEVKLLIVDALDDDE